jgi:GT2 family glycosyltransferase
VTAAVVVPNYNGARWLPGCLDSLAAQSLAPADVIVVDNGSRDESPGLASARPGVRVLRLGRNLGFAAAANRGIATAETEAVALVNTDVVLAPDWLERMVQALESAPDVGAVACKMVGLDDPAVLYDAGDVLRRDGVCEQRGRFQRDDGRFDAPGEVFAACAGAALYRRRAVLDVGGLDERFFLYLEDVDLGLRLRLAGWRCRYEPAVARHAGQGSAAPGARSPWTWVERNTLLLALKAFPARWAPLVLYRQAAWAWHALREGRLRAHLRGAAGALPLLGAMAGERRRLRSRSVVPVEVAVPARPIRGLR